MPIVPDDKDWTWVLERPCPECGFDARDVAAPGVAAGLRDNAARWRPLLDHPNAGVRPTEDRWSALEYACHVRDVYRRFIDRLALMLAEDDPTFANWDQDATAIEGRYAEQDPSVVLDELEAAGAELAAAFDRVQGDQWQRPGARSDGARFTVETMARYLLHDPVHHVWDVETGYAHAE
ncbi:MAG: DinB family protein [Microthrixaceae bacterium]